MAWDFHSNLPFQYIQGKKSLEMLIRRYWHSWKSLSSFWYICALLLSKKPIYRDAAKRLTVDDALAHILPCPRKDARAVAHLPKERKRASLQPRQRKENRPPSRHDSLFRHSLQHPISRSPSPPRKSSDQGTDSSVAAVQKLSVDARDQIEAYERQVFELTAALHVQNSHLRQSQDLCDEYKRTIYSQRIPLLSLILPRAGNQNAAYCGSLFRG